MTTLPPVSDHLPPSTSPFVQSTPFELRLQCAEKKMRTSSARVPVILETAPHVPFKLEKCRFWVPAAGTVADLMQSVRKQTKLGPEQALFLFVNNTLPPMNMLMSQLYRTHSASDRFLYAVLHTETTFG